MSTLALEIQSASGRRVRIKNTFLDDVEDDEYVVTRDSNSRRIRTCPDLTWPEEPESELSPERAPANMWQVNAEPECDLLTKRGGERLLRRLLSETAPKVPIVSIMAQPVDESAATSTAQTFSGCAGLVLSATCRCRDNWLSWEDDPATPICHALVENREVSQPREHAAVLATAPVADQQRKPRGRRDGKNELEAPNVQRLGDCLPMPVEEEEPVRIPQARRSKERNANKNKFWCHFFINEGMQKPGFELNKKIIGHGGRGTKSIFDATGAKIRLRGHGSGHIEGSREAPVHLMLSVTAPHGEHANFRKACVMAADLLQDVGRRFANFCEKNQESLLEEPCYWVGDISPDSQACVDGAIEGISSAYASKGNKNKNARSRVR